MARLDIQRTHDGSVEHLQLRPGENRVQVRPGHQFRLDRSEVDPELLRVLKVDSDLVIEGIPLGAAAAVTPDDATALPEGATVVLEGYYRVCSASDRCTVTVDDGTANTAAVAEGELGSTGLVLADVGTQPLGALSDGNFVLYDPKFEAPILPMLADGSARPLLYGLGGAAVLGLALGGGGGGGGDSGLPPQGDISLQLKSSNYFNNRFPTISGTAQPGSDVQVRIDTDGDQRANVTYTTKADASGNWSVNLRTATPSSGELPAAGLSDSNTMEVVGTHNGVQSILPVTTLTFDDTPPAKAEISQVAGDNIINGSERDAGVAFSGTSEANGTVELKVGNTTRLVPVDANGNWSTTLGKDDLPATDGEYTVTVTSMDAAGNRGPENTTLITMNTSGKQAIIGTVAGTDNVVNAQEAAAPIKVAGVAEANAKLKFQIVDSQNKVIDLPNAEATADANGQWTLDMTLPAGLADGKYTLSVTSTNAVGNTATGTREFTVDKTPPAPVSKVTVEGGDLIITNKEAKSGVDVTGTAEPGAKVRVTVAGGKTLEATAGANGAWKVTLHDTDLPTLNKGASVPGSLAITAEDKAGNVSAEYKQAVTLEGPPVDAKTPTIETPGALGDSYLNSEEAKAPMKISGGGVSAGDKVKVTMGGIALPDATADQNGNWSTTASAAVLGRLTNGPKEIVATAETSQGGMSPAAGKLQFTVDKVAPAQASNIQANGGDLIIDSGEAKQGIAHFTGDAPADAAKVRVTWAGQDTTVDVVNGKWQADFTKLPSPAAGKTEDSIVTATTIDAAGNTGATTRATVTVHSAQQVPTKAPVIDKVSDDGYVNAKEVANATISGTAEPNATVTVSLQGQPGKTATATADKDGKWNTTINLAGVADGEHVLTATAKAPNGEASPAGTKTFTLDKTPPTISGLTSSDGPEIDATEAANGVVFSGKTEANAKVTATWDKVTRTVQADANGDWNITFADKEVPKVEQGKEGDFPLTVSAEDTAGNTGPKATLPLKVSGPAKPAPLQQTTIKGPLTADNIINENEDDKVTVSGTAQPGAKVELSVDYATNTRVVGSGIAGSDGQWTIDTNLSHVAPQNGGKHKLFATATVTGSTEKSTAEHEFTIDRVVEKPTAVTYNDHSSSTITDAERADGVVLAGKAEPNSKLKITVADGTSQEVNANAAGDWTSKPFTLPAAEAGKAQKYGVAFEVTDGAGNGPTQFSGDDITVQGPTAQPTPKPPASGSRSVGGSSQIVDDTDNAAGNAGTGDTTQGNASTPGTTTPGAGAGSTSDAGAGAGTTPSSASDADGPAGPTATPGSTAGGATGSTATPGNAGTTNAGSGSAAAKPGASAAANEDAADNDQQGTAVTTASLKSAGDSTTTLATKSLGGSKLSLADLLDQGSHDGLTLPGSHASAGAAAPTAGVADLGTAAAAHNATSTVNTLLGTQQPWEHQPLV